MTFLTEESALTALELNRSALLHRLISVARKRGSMAQAAQRPFPALASAAPLHHNGFVNGGGFQMAGLGLRASAPAWVPQGGPRPSFSPGTSGGAAMMPMAPRGPPEGAATTTAVAAGAASTGGGGAGPPGVAGRYGPMAQPLARGNVWRRPDAAVPAAVVSKDAAKEDAAIAAAVIMSTDTPKEDAGGEKAVA